MKKLLLSCFLFAHTQSIINASSGSAKYRTSPQSPERKAALNSCNNRLGLKNSSSSPCHHEDDYDVTQSSAEKIAQCIHDIVTQKFQDHQLNSQFHAEDAPIQEEQQRQSSPLAISTTQEDRTSKDILLPTFSACEPEHSPSFKNKQRKLLEKKSNNKNPKAF